MNCIFGVRFNAIRALGCRGNGYRHKLPVFYGDNAIVSFSGMFKIKECRRLFGSCGHRAPGAICPVVVTPGGSSITRRLRNSISAPSDSRQR